MRLSSETLARYETFPTRLAEVHYANTLASLSALGEADMLRLVSEAINAERFANYDTRWTDMADRGLLHMLGEAERATKGWAL